MSMARTDQWIPGVSPDDRASDVAGRTLRFRLAAVQHYLPLAAEKPDEDVEYVHERAWPRGGRRLRCDCTPTCCRVVEPPGWKRA